MGRNHRTISPPTKKKKKKRKKLHILVKCVLEGKTEISNAGQDSYINQDPKPACSGGFSPLLRDLDRSPKLLSMTGKRRQQR